MRAATCGSRITSGGGSGRSWRRPSTRPTGRCSTSRGTIRYAARRTTRTPTRFSPRSTAGMPRDDHFPRTPSSPTTAPPKCGCWIYCGVHAGGINQAARRKPGQQQSWVAPEWGWAWPANRRVLYNRASADPDGKPWSERKALVWWDEEQGRWVGHDVPDFIADRPPSYRPPKDATGPAAISGIDPFIMQADGKAWLFAPAGLVDGPMPTHYEPQESPFPNLLYGQQHNPVRQLIRHPENRYQPSGDQPGVGRVPVRDHHVPAHRAPHRRGHVPVPALPVGTAARVLLRGLTAARGRARPRPPRVGDDHHGPQRHRGTGAGHRPDASARGAGPNAAPGRAALALGTERATPRGMPPTSWLTSRSIRMCTSRR